jgi:hypothetical protein
VPSERVLSAFKIDENRNPAEDSNHFISVVCLIPFLRFYLFIIQFGPFVGISFKSIAQFILGFAVVAIRTKSCCMTSRLERSDS